MPIAGFPPTRKLSPALSPRGGGAFYCAVLAALASPEGIFPVTLVVLAQGGARPSEPRGGLRTPPKLSPTLTRRGFSFDSAAPAQRGFRFRDAGMRAVQTRLESSPREDHLAPYAMLKTQPRSPGGAFLLSAGAGHRLLGSAPIIMGPSLASPRSRWAGFSSFDVGVAGRARLFREEPRLMAKLDDRTRRMLIQNSELSRQSIENSSRARIDAIMDICTKPDIVWAVWPNGQSVIKGHELVATGAAKTSWIAIPCADRAEAADLERRLA